VRAISSTHIRMKNTQIKDEKGISEKLSLQRPSLACFPLYPPLELFHSMGLNPFVLWGLNDIVRELDKSDRHLQVYVCSVARVLTQFFVSHPKIFQGLFHYNACDTLRNLPEIIIEALDEGDRNLPTFNFHLPMSNPGSAKNREYLKNEIQLLISNLEKKLKVSFSENNFKESANLFYKLRNLLSDADQKIAYSNTSFSEFIKINRLIQFETPEKQVSIITDELKKLDILSPGTAGKSTSGKKTILSGILPPPPEIIQLIEESGIKIAGNDIATLTRNYRHNPKPRDVYSFYDDFYFNHIPCPTLLFSTDNRVDFLLTLVKERQAESIIFIGEKYCECEYFEFPFMRKVLTENKIKTLVLEMDAARGDSVETYRTRIEAFSELCEN